MLQVGHKFIFIAFYSSLFILVPVAWIVEPRDITAIEGSQLVVSCSADGYPLPTVSLFRLEEGREELMATGISIVSSNITSVSRQDSATFFCSASNTAAPYPLRKEFKLSVQG